MPFWLFNRLVNEKLLFKRIYFAFYEDEFTYYIRIACVGFNIMGSTILSAQVVRKQGIEFKSNEIGQIVDSVNC